MAVIVVSSEGIPLNQCSEKRARILLDKKKAEVLNKEPFTIKLLDKTAHLSNNKVGGINNAS